MTSSSNNTPTGSVMITGSAVVGQTVNVDASGVTDPDGFGRFVNYTWYADGVALTGGFASTTNPLAIQFPLTADYLGKTITVKYSYYDALGNLETVTSTGALVTTENNRSPTGSVLITGSAVVGQTVNVDASGVTDPDGFGRFVNYTWHADGVALTGGFASTTNPLAIQFPLTADYLGKTITVKYSYYDALGNLETVTSTGALVTTENNRSPTGSVLITGSAVVGQTVNVDASGVTDPDGFGRFVNYTWYADGVALTGGFASTTNPLAIQFPLTADYLGKTITVKYSYYDALGNLETVTSTGALVTTENNRSPTGSVLITGSAVVGQTVNVDASGVTDPDGFGRFVNYTWYADGVALTGGFASTTNPLAIQFPLTADYLGKTITVKYSYYDALGNLETVTSTGALVTTENNRSPTGSVLITGSAVVGQTVNVDASGVTDPDGFGRFVNYTWYADGVALTGGFASTTNPLAIQFPLTADYLGKTITVKYSYYDALGNLETVTSTGALVTTENNRSPTGSVLITGSAVVGQTLIVDTSGIEDLDGITNVVFVYQWLRNGVAIPDATAMNYKITAQDEGEMLSVRVRYVDDGGSVEVITSNPAEPVRSVESETPPFRFVLSSENDGGAIFSVFADPLVDPEEDGIGALEFLVRHDPSDLRIDLGSVTFASGFTGVPRYDSTTGTLEIGAFRYPNFVDLASPILTFNAAVLEETQPFDVRITNTIVDSNQLPDTVETFDFSTVDLAATVVDRFGRALSSAEVIMFEASGGDQFYIRENGYGASGSVFEIVVCPGSALSAIDFDLTDLAGFGSLTLSSALSGWTVQTNTSTPGKVLFSGFAAVDGSTDIVAGAETVVATFTSGTAPDFLITDIALNGAAQRDVSVGEVAPVLKSGSLTQFEVGRGSDILVIADKDIDAASDRAIGAFDALQALRLAVGLTKSNGKAEWHDFIAADINKDGRVGADDALNILKFAVGLTGGPSADWVFVDSDADWSGVGRRSSSYDEGLRLDDLMIDRSVNLVGILVGDVDASYVA